MASEATTRSDGTHAARWARESSQRVPYGLGIALLLVTLPVASGVRGFDSAIPHHRNELISVISLVSLFACLVLALAAAIGGRRRDWAFAVGGLGLVVAHPLLDSALFLTVAWMDAIRLAIGAASLIGLTALLPSDSMTARSVRRIGLTLAGLALGVSLLAADAPMLSSASLPTAALAFGAACVSLGGIAFIYGQRRCDGALTSFAMAATTIGFGELLALRSGDLTPTVGLAAIAVTGAITAFAAAVVALFEALARAELRHDADVISRDLAIARLEARADRFAELAHDQRSSLLAIEAAAQQLQTKPSGALAGAVASEAARLNRLLADRSSERGSFDLRAAVVPMAQCMAALGTEIGVDVQGDVTVWGNVDEVVEIVGVLVDNALTHGLAPVRVEIDECNDGARLRVTDSGPGVAPPLRQSVFERGVTTLPASNSGLGLFSARQIAEQHGGSLEIADDDAFELVLPRTPSAPVTAPVEDFPPVDLRPVVNG